MPMDFASKHLKLLFHSRKYKLWRADLTKIGGKHFVIDTGRNGNGPTSDHQWCNPWAELLEHDQPQILVILLSMPSSGSKVQDHQMEIVTADPNAGQWWPDYAIEIAKNTHW
jgi:endoglucanase